MAKHIVKIDEDLEDIVPVFLKNLDIALTEIKEAIDTSDIKCIQSHAHKIKGNAGGYGFSKLSEYGKEMEQNAKDNDLEKIKIMYNSITDFLSDYEIQYVEEDDIE